MERDKPGNDISELPKASASSQSTGYAPRRQAWLARFHDDAIREPAERLVMGRANATAARTLGTT